METVSNHLNVPVLGLQYAYWLDEGLGFGLRNVVDLSKYQLQNSDSTLMNRVYPFSSSYRKTICYSKCDEMLKVCVKLYMLRRNLQTSIINLNWSN